MADGDCITYESPVVSVYTRLATHYKNILDSEGNPIESNFEYPNKDLTWIVDGEPISATSKDNINTVVDRIDNTERIYNGTNTSGNPDGTLNRLPKQLLKNDIALYDHVISVSKGISKSFSNAMLGLCRGFVSTVTIVPDYDSFNNSTYGIYNPKIFVNSFNVENRPEKTKRFLNSNINFSPTIADSFSFYVMEFVRRGAWYCIDISIRMNNAFINSLVQNTWTFKHKAKLEFLGFEGSPTITFNNISQGNIAEHSNNEHGYNTDMFNTTNFKATTFVRGYDDGMVRFTQERGFMGIGVESITITIQESIN